MKITEKNKAIKQIQKLFKGITIKAIKRDFNSSDVEVIISENFIDTYVTEINFRTDKYSLQVERTNKGLTQSGIDLKNQIMEIINNGIKLRETGDYGTQPSEYWNLEFSK